MKLNSVYTFLERNSYLFPLSLILITLVTLALTLFPADMMGSTSVWDYDKLGHLILFGGWTYSLGLYNQITGISSVTIKSWMIAALGILFGLTIEVLQYALPVHRHADPMDLLADIIGCLIAIWLLRYTPKNVRRKDSE